MMSRIKVATKGWKGEIEAKDGQDAVKQFWILVVKGKIEWDQLGQIGTWMREDGEEIAFRIAPTLYNLSFISWERYAENIAETVGAGMTDKQLSEMAEADEWMVADIGGAIFR